MSVQVLPKSDVVTTFTMRVDLNGRQVSVHVTPHWKVL